MVSFTNGDFETGDLTGWATSGTITIEEGAHGGTYCCAISGPGYISQAVDLTNQQSVTFWFKNISDITALSYKVYVDTDEVYSTTAHTYHSWGSITTNNFTYSGSKTVKFELVSVSPGDAPVYLDDIIINEYQYVASPATGIYNILEYTPQYATGIYNIKEAVNSYATGPYNIDLSAYGTGIYDIAKRPPSAGKASGKGGSLFVKLGDPADVNLRNIIQGRIEQKLNQVGVFDVTLAAPSATVINELSVGATTRLFVEDFKYMTGFVKRIEHDRMKGFYRTIGESVAAVLRDTTITEPIEEDSWPQKSYSIIQDHLTPTGWTYNYHGAEGYYIKYRANSGSYLTHIKYICALNGWDWYADEEYDVYKVLSVTSNSVTIDGTLTTDYYNGRYAIFTVGAAQWEHDVVADNTTNTVTFTTIDPSALGVVAGDAIALMGKFELHTGILGDGSIGAPAKTFTNNSDIVYVNTNTDQDRIVTVVAVPGGISQTSDKLQTISANTLRVVSFNDNEDLLKDNMTAAQTTIPLNDSSWYPMSGTVKIGSEKITYTNRDDNAGTLTGCSRGALGTSAAAHYVGDPVLMQDRIQWVCLPGRSTYFDASGNIWIGTEKVTYTGTTGGGGFGEFTGLTRGADSTTAYNHRRGTWIRDAQYTNVASEAGSPVALYGLRGKRVEALGVTDQDGMDKLSQEILNKYTAPSTSGTGTLPAICYWEDFTLGDYIKINFATAPTTLSTRLTGFTWQWGKLMDISFGYPEDYIYDELTTIYKVQDVAVEKTDKSEKVTVVATESTAKYVQVQYADGTTEWLESL